MTTNFEQEHPKSPCNDVCVMEPETGLCKGCLRTIDEIVAWPSLTDDEKREVLSRVEERSRR